ncbi:MULTISPECIES: hypothetical protein [Staphylococcus]|uniref:Mobilization protein n=2 Tax=Staphylococcus borealis TaxID=2742203 RepID=A0ABX2LVI2_9STAP|nr:MULTISPECIES: hypothetical protein [Staphylococcus]MCQ9280056.1 hypothetical protein [Staphylococcus borealis]MDM7862947.1 hypothetical protein [Staphylococcus borealis]MDM7881998.1 hypothetical protein [Staphylococcus borealis]MDY4022788.1 hypothetical protein [Staphylococcus borealis]MEB6608916.1 hypothetical protein [Staphylococcus borealis]
MKYRIIAGVIFLIILIVATFYVQPMLTLDNQLSNLIYILVLVIIGAVLGYISRRLDGK